MPSHPKPPRADQLRTDIQGLRAIAVGVVLVFHLSSDWLPGGYVGVDAFFVISGFLITSHLLARRHESGRDLLKFWSRRIRRLLPASLLVLVATLVATRLVAPDTLWENTARQTRAAALYFVNWLLAHDAVDYLAAENAATPVQHFWSLSVEEQFYFVWPLLIFAAAWLAVRRGASEAAYVGVALGLVVVGSFAYSVTETSSNPAAAYFVTPTRVWELGVGGLLALAFAGEVFGRQRDVRLPPAVSAAVAWAGLAAIAVTCWTYSGSTPFPGYQAALPVLGTAAVIAARPEPGGWGPGSLLALRPVQWLGDISYAVYLWHWPLVILLPFASGGHLGNLDRASIVLATLALAALTKKYVEDPFRSARWGVPLKKPYALGALGMAGVVALATLQITEVQRTIDRDADRLQQAMAGDDPCFGAAALDRPGECDPVPFDEILPGPSAAAMDKSDAYKDIGGKDCWSYLPRFPDVRCVFGERDADTDVTLVGNSHAGQWLPAVQRIADTEDLRITTRLASRCAYSQVGQTFRTDAHTEVCSRWVARTTDAIIADRPDLVVISNRISAAAAGSTLAESEPAYREGYRTILQEYADAGIRVLVIRDNPTPGFSVPDCLAEREDDYAECGDTRAAWEPLDPAPDVVRSLDVPWIRTVDLTDHICGPERCDPVVGGVVVYFDATHLTATFAATLAPYLRPAVVDALAVPVAD